MIPPTGKPGFFKILLTSSTVFVLSRAAGFLVPFVLALSYGVSQFMDDFFLALAFQSFIGTTLGSIAEVIVVPSLARKQIAGESGGPFLRFLLKWGFFASLGFVAVLALPASILFSKPAMQAYWTLALYPPLAVCTGILLGAFNAREHYNWTAGVPGGRAVAIVLGLLLLPEGSYWILAGVITGAEFLLLACLGARAVHCQMLEAAGREKRSCETLKNAFILSLGTFLLGLNPLVDKTFASFLGTGSISLMEYSLVLFYIPANLFHGPLLTILLTRWAKDGCHERMAVESNRAVGYILLISLAVMAVYLLVGRWLLEMGLGARISSTDLNTLWTGAAILLAGLAPYVIGGIYARILLVAGMTRVISAFAFLNALLNLSLNALLVGPFGLFGILVSTSLTSLVVAITLGSFTWKNYLSPRLNS